jgi:hypothetical protein
MPWYSSLRVLRPEGASVDQFLSQTARELASFVSPTGA